MCPMCGKPGAPIRGTDKLKCSAPSLCGYVWTPGSTELGFTL